MNAVHLAGKVGDYGCRITWTEQSKPQTSFTLIVEEAGRDGASFKTFVPICIIGTQAEPLAERLEAGDHVLVSGKLSYKSGKTKDAGRVMVMCFGVEVLATAPATATH
ncbi:MAG: single-stranded DNA-binding protein [Candidatus Entotheonellia bacterium]